MRELLAYSQGAVIEEKLALRIKANDDWDIFIPVAWYSPDGTQDCKYAWKISIDGWNEVNYSGTGSSSGSIRVWYGLIPLSVHTVIIKPQVEDYGWLRAFWYKGTSYASFLVNIISDKSYKGYALSDMYSGNWYKAYQYYGCSNLINTDEELLPDTLEIIGDNYRYYEYAGCSSLVSNAEEKILKTVKVIWDNYRAYQYQNCYSLSKVNMRAINWASVGNNYRYNQLSWIATDKKPANIYIEGWIEEGGNWWLSDTRVKNVYVYYGLVASYKSKLSAITDSKIKKNPDWDNLEYEFIEFIAKADSSGKIRIPVGWYSTAGNQDCAYDWYVSIDGWEAEEINGTGSNSYVSIGSGLTEGSEHRIVIKPKTVNYWWGRAFGYYNTWAEWYIKQIIHDSYKCYGYSRVSTWAYYKYRTYKGCINLINSYEKLPTSITNVGNSYMKECCMGCTSLTTAFWEVMHKWCTIGTDYRMDGYSGCTALSKHQWMAGYMGDTYPSGYKDNYLLNAGTNLELYISRLERMYILNFASGNYYGWGTMTLATITRAGRYIFSGNLQGTSSNTWFDVQIWQNNTKLWTWSAPDPWTEFVKFEINCQVWDVIQIRAGYEQRYGNMNSMKLEYSNVLWLVDNYVKNVKVFVDDIYTYKNNNAWSDLSKSKFSVYYFDYQPIPAVDISKYTTLVGTYSAPWSIDVSSSTRLYTQFTNWSYVWIAVAGTSNNQVYVSWERINLNNGAVYGALIKLNWNSWGTSYAWDWINTGGRADYYDGTVHWAYGDQKGNILDAEEYRHYSWGWYTQYRELSGGRWSIDIQGSTSWWNSWICAWRDGRTVVWEGKTYYTTTRWGSGLTEIGGYSGTYTGIDFSDDGLTVYLQENLGTIKQYNLSSAWDLSSVKTDTGKSLSISWSFAITKDKKYLYVWNGSLKVYQYTP